MVGDFFPIDGAPCPGNIGIICVTDCNSNEVLQFFGKLFQHFLVIVCNVTAVGSGISGEFSLIEVLQII